MKPNLRLLPTEVWVDIFRYDQPWLSRPKLGQLMDQIGNRKFAEFLQFYLHEWGKHELGKFEFTMNGLYKEISHYPNRQALQIPQTPIPENIKSFKQIEIRHFDSRTLDFFRLIRPLLANVNLVNYCRREKRENLRTVLAHLSPLLDGGIHSIFSYENYIPWAPQMFTGNLNMDQLKVLSFNYLGNCWQVLPVEEQAAQLDATINFFLNWLTSPGTGPRLYITYMHPTLFQQIATAVQQNFFAAKSPSTFVLKLELFNRYRTGYTYFGPEVERVADFHLENNNTREHLDGRRSVDGEQETFQISRHQANAGKELEEWVRETEKKRCMTRIVFNEPVTIGSFDATTGGGEVNEGGERKAADQPSTSKQH